MSKFDDDPRVTPHGADGYRVNLNTGPPLYVLNGGDRYGWIITRHSAFEEVEHDMATSGTAAGYADVDQALRVLLHIAEPAFVHQLPVDATWPYVPLADAGHQAA